MEDEDNGGTKWVPATVQSVHLDSTFSAEIEGADGTWIDWFTWEDEGTDWRREEGLGFLSTWTCTRGQEERNSKDWRTRTFRKREAFRKRSKNSKDWTVAVYMRFRIPSQ